MLGYYFQILLSPRQRSLFSSTMKLSIAASALGLGFVELLNPFKEAYN